MTSVTFTYPLDIVRTRLSIQSASFKGLGARDANRKLPGMWGLMKIMYKTEGGFTALYRGIIPTVAGVAPYVSYASNQTQGIRAARLTCSGRSQLHGVRVDAWFLHSKR